MPGSIKLFRLFGIDVFLHWSWVIIAVIQIQRVQKEYHSPIWGVLEYLTLFAIVTIHEFGHSLACRSVGGRANKIMLWPLGGVAYVEPPNRAGAQLWSIVAGPLVNFILLFPTFFLYRYYGPCDSDLCLFIQAIFVINLILLVFNMLPIYPLDGGQILRAILWFFVGPRTSLKIASIIGLIGAGAGVAFAFWINSIWLIIMAVFAGMKSWNGFRIASEPLVTSGDQITQVPWHDNIKCPACGNSPPAIALWRCDQCGTPFDTFASGFACPNCHKTFETTGCPHCQRMIPKEAWIWVTPETHA